MDWEKGNTQYYLIFFTDRMVFAKIGGQFPDHSLGTVTGSILNGTINSAIVEAFDTQQKRGNKMRTENILDLSRMQPDEVLALNRMNFQIMYDDVNRVAVKKSVMGLNGTRAGVLEIDHGKRERFDLAPGQDYLHCEGIVKAHLLDKI